MICEICGGLMILKEEDADKKVYECLGCGRIHVIYKIMSTEVDVGC